MIVLRLAANKLVGGRGPGWGRAVKQIWAEVAYKDKKLIHKSGDVEQFSSHKSVYRSGVT
jgi:hypothetical protein